MSRALIAALVLRGVTTFVLCPGSRSAPLAYALNDAERAGLITLHVETDERVAGFIALGSSVAGAPAAVVTTSGSAVANLHPAVEEAFYAGVEMIVISADRPAEIRGVRANQTTDHRAVLAGSVRHFLELPAGAPTAHVPGLVERAVRVGRGIGVGNVPGPVHINVALREPLMPKGSWETVREDCAAATEVSGVRRCVVVAGPTTLGPLDPDIFAGVPILAEPSSALRSHPNAIMAHPILLSSALGAEITDVVVIGHPTLTRDVSQLLADESVTVYAVDEAPSYTDVAGRARVIDVEEISEYLAGDEAWLARWRLAADTVRSGLESPDLDFLAVTRALNTAAVRTIVGASSIIRELNLYGDAPAAPVHANRGLAGIDGTVSTAIGVALGSGEPVRVVLGDLSFIHDAGSLIHTAGQETVDIDVVVIDDSGGSLFSTLEYGASDSTTYDRLFRTEKELDLAHYAAAVGARYIPVTDIAGLKVLDDVPHGVRLIHVKLERRDVEAERTARAQRRGALVDAVAVALGKSQ